MKDDTILSKSNLAGLRLFQNGGAHGLGKLWDQPEKLVFVCQDVPLISNLI